MKNNKRHRFSSSVINWAILWLILFGFSSGVNCQNEIKLIVSPGYSDPGSKVIYSPDGKTLVIGESGVVRLWSVENRRELRAFSGMLYSSSMSFSPEGKVLAVGDRSSVRLWGVESGQELRSIPTGSYDVRFTALSPGGKVLAISDGKTIELWDMATGRGVCTLPLKGTITSFVFNPDGKSLVVMTSIDDNSAILDDKGGNALTDDKNENVTIWDVQTHAKLRTFSGDRFIAFSPNGKLLTIGNRGVITLFDAESGKALHIIDKRISAQADKLAFSPDGKVLAISGKGFIQLINTDTGGELRAFDSGIPSNISALGPGGKTLVTVNNESIEVQDVESKRILFTVFQAAPTDSITFSPGGRMLAFIDAKRVKIWSADSGKELSSIPGDYYGIHKVTFSPTGKMLAINDARRIKLWDLNSGRELRTIINGTYDKLMSSFSPDEKILAVSDRRTVRLLDLKSGREVYNFSSDSYRIHQVTFRPKGKALAVGDGRDIRMLDIDTGRELYTISGEGTTISFAFSPDGRSLVISDSKTIKFFDAETGKALKTIERMYESFDSAFSPDGKTLAVSDRKTVRLLDVSSGDELHAFSGNGSVGSFAFSPDGHILAWTSGKRIDFSNTSNGQHLSSLIVVGQNDWSITTPEGRFDASPGAYRHMHYSYGLEIISLEQLKDVYYEPGLMRKLLGYDREPLRPVRPLRNIRLFPEVIERNYDPTTSVLSISLRNRGGGIGPVRVMVGAKLAYEDARSQELIANPNQDAAQISVDLSKFTHTLSPDSKITIITNNLDPETGKGYISSRGAELAFSGSHDVINAPVNFYAIVGGISDYADNIDPESNYAGNIDLKYAAKDAEAMASALELAAKNLFSHTRVITLSTSKNPGTIWPSKKNFHNAFKEIGERATKQDIVLVYLAGHGVSIALNNDTYFYLTAEATSTSREALQNPDYRTSSTISSVELIDWLTQTEWVKGKKGIAAQKQVMILDTCAAGAVANNLSSVAKREQSTDQIRAIERLKDRTGFYVLMGSAADTPSYEAGKYGQGVMTYALLEGMTGSALVDGRYVDVSTLFQKTANVVPELARDIGGVQRPIIAAPDGTSFDIGIIMEKDRDKIPLARHKAVVLRPLFTTGKEGDDTLDMIGKVGSSLNESTFLQSRGGNLQSTFVYRNEENLRGAIRPTGTYTIRGGHVRLQLYLRRDGLTIMTLPIIQGKASELDVLVTKVTKEIRTALIKIK